MRFFNSCNKQSCLTYKLQELGIANRKRIITRIHEQQHVVSGAYMISEIPVRFPAEAFAVIAFNCRPVMARQHKRNPFY